MNKPDISEVQWKYRAYLNQFEFQAFATIHFPYRLSENSGKIEVKQLEKFLALKLRSRIAWFYVVKHGDAGSHIHLLLAFQRKENIHYLNAATLKKLEYIKNTTIHVFQTTEDKQNAIAYVTKARNMSPDKDAFGTPTSFSFDSFGIQEKKLKQFARPTDRPLKFKKPKIILDTPEKMKYLTVTQFSREYGFSKNFIYKHYQRLGGTKIGGIILFTQEGIDNALLPESVGELQGTGNAQQPKSVKSVHKLRQRQKLGSTTEKGIPIDLFRRAERHQLTGSVQ